MSALDDDNNGSDNWRRIEKHLDDRQLFANTAEFQTPGSAPTIVIRFQVTLPFLCSALSPPPFLICRK